MNKYSSVGFAKRELERKKSKRKRRNGKRRRLATHIFFIN